MSADRQSGGAATAARTDRRLGGSANEPPGQRSLWQLRRKPGGRLDRNFWLLWGGWSISSVGNGLTVTTLPLLAAELTQDPAVLSLVGIADRLPWLLLALTGGALSDRWDRRRSLWVADSIRCAILVGLALAIIVDRLSIALLMVIAFAITSIETLYDSSRAAILPMIVSQDRAELERANRRLMTANTVALRFIGPALGGWLYTVGRVVPAAADAVTFCLSSLFSFLMRGDFKATGHESRSRPKMRQEIVHGVRWLLGNHVLRVFTVVAGLTNMWTVGQMAMMVLYAKQVMHIGEAAYGVLLASVAVGSVTAGFTASWISQRLGPARAAFGGLAVGGLAFASIGYTHSSVLVGLSLAVTGYSAMAWNISVVSVRQALVPSSLTGRVSSVNRLVAFGLMPLGIFAAGQIASHLGLSAVYRIGGIFSAVVCVVGLLLVSNAAVVKALEEAEAARKQVNGHG